MKYLIHFYLLACILAPIIQNEPAIKHERVEVCQLSLVRVTVSQINKDETRLE
jgi:hypothetical protein